MSNNSSLVSIATVLVLLTGSAAAYTGYQHLRDNAQQGFLLKASYQAHTNAMQAIYLAERAATDSSYTTDMDNLESAVERALAALRNGDPVRGIEPAPAVVLANLKNFDRVWEEIGPSISKLISQRSVTDQYSRNLAETQRVAQEALKAATEARSQLDSTSTTAPVKNQLKAAVAALEEGQQALASDNSITSDTLRAASSAFSQYVATLGRLGQALPKDQQEFMVPLVKSYRDSESVVRLVQKTIDSSTGVSENIPHAKTIWAARDRVASSANSLISSVEALPDSRPISITIVAGLGGLTLLLSLISMLMMRSITSSRTESIESQGRNQEVSISTRSKHLKLLLDEIELIGQGRLNTRLTEDNESTRDIATALNKTFGKFATILDEAKETIIGLSAATEQTLITEQNVAKNRSEQDKAIEHISRLFGDLYQFIIQIENMTLGTQRISDDMSGKVGLGEVAVSQVHDNILELQQQTLLIQNRSKHMIESFQVLENIANVVAEVASRSALLSYNANLLADEMQDKGQSSRIASAAKAMSRLSEETKDAVVQINVQLKTMNDAARENQSAVDRAQRETDKLRDRSNVAQDALKAINELAGDLTQGAQQAIEETNKLKAKSSDVSDLVDSVNQYSADNSAASEQTAVAIKGVNRQAQDLQATISTFIKE
ncbi:methyl-accepting chemotaxis protein [Pseudomonas mosselii]|uniref:methyl-accepting chemotaxis protein n=1 Tax=Pseudomonas mosselii TaxID=78327 RepID=UPI0021D93CA0|nr:methyl-accepting chemotaxis protein [Pseudomonas mosselii]MCU9528527.1 methyl-accepting chemotaxis protein [Pseudomonas mosselii]MCU9535861.1 methyl-accepting chemotaxis protein [Pseudomonas mosselii]MCU9542919.1 methyl-accepting chemotaxis protein [Pseudomonas mosselii]MCU9548800.1 methyl-accepting chemotaxis protein [Pseudomonas mosselii]